MVKSKKIWLQGCKRAGLPDSTKKGAKELGIFLYNIDQYRTVAQMPSGLGLNSIDEKQQASKQNTVPEAFAAGVHEQRLPFLRGVTLPSLALKDLFSESTQQFIRR